ncbi:hypothetical protein EMIT0P218_30169 [Pseudomonas sp. IT-P218]
MVDTSNYYPDLRDVRIAALENGQTESVWGSEQIGRPVIKACNFSMTLDSTRSTVAAWRRHGANSPVRPRTAAITPLKRCAQR